MSTEEPLLYMPPVTGSMQHPQHPHALQQSASSFSNPLLSSEWYTQHLSSSPPSYNATQPTLDKPYLTPLTSTINDPTPLQVQTSFQEAGEPLSLTTVGSSYGNYHHAPARPHSSPSCFGPAAEDLLWANNPLRISNASMDDHQYIPTTYPPAPRILSPPRPSHHFSPERFHDIRTPQPQRFYPSIAPNPVGMMPMNPTKRTRDEESSPEMPPKRRQRSTSSAISSELNEEDRLLVKLKDEENLPWKDIAARFKTDLGKAYQVPALQMRFKRLRERLRVWTDTDMNALRLAHEYWQKNKFEIIASKMVEFGSTEKWSARQCARKWQEIAPNSEFYMSHSVPTPFSQTSSPVEGPGYVSFMNLP